MIRKQGFKHRAGCNIIGHRKIIFSKKRPNLPQQNAFDP